MFLIIIRNGFQHLHSSSPLPHAKWIPLFHLLEPIYTLDSFLDYAKHQLRILLAESTEIALFILVVCTANARCLSNWLTELEMVQPSSWLRSMSSSNWRIGMEKWLEKLKRWIVTSMYSWRGFLLMERRGGYSWSIITAHQFGEDTIEMGSDSRR